MGFFTRVIQVPVVNLLNKLFGIPYQYSIIHQTHIDSDTLFPYFYTNYKKCDSDCECDNCGDDYGSDHDCYDDHDNNQVLESYSNDQELSTETEEDTDNTEEEPDTETNNDYKGNKVLINEPLD